MMHAWMPDDGVHVDVQGYAPRYSLAASGAISWSFEAARPLCPVSASGSHGCLGVGAHGRASRVVLPTVDTTRTASMSLPPFP